MRTYKRMPPTVNNGSFITNYNKSVNYFNQLQFKGILEDDNIFAVDQESFRNAENVYVNIHDQLVSRPTLQKDYLPTNIQNFLDASEYFSLGYILVDIKDAGQGKVYVLKKTKGTAANKYTIIYAPDDINITVTTDTLTDLEKYHISINEHYIICFNNTGAKVINTDKITNNVMVGWEDFSEYAYIPVTKSIVGGTTTEYPGNQFTSAYKERYIWSNESHPVLPSGTGEVEVITKDSSYSLNVPDTKTMTDYRIIKKADVTVTPQDIVTVDKSGLNRICVAREFYFLLSLNGGEVFTRINYPIYEGNFKNIASISDDGQFFFFVTDWAVYQCDLSTFEWIGPISIFETQGGVTTRSRIEYSAYNNMCCFKSGDAFSFVTFQQSLTSAPDKIRIYFKGPGLYMGSDPTQDNKLGYIELSGDYNLATLIENYKTQINMTTTIINNLTVCSIAAVIYTSINSYYEPEILYILGGDTSTQTGSNNMYYELFPIISNEYNTPTYINLSNMSSFNIFPFGDYVTYSTVGGVLLNTLASFNVNGSIVHEELDWCMGFWQDEGVWYKHEYTEDNISIPDDYQQLFQKLTGGYIGSKTVASQNRGTWELKSLTKPTSTSVTNLFTTGDYFYMVLDNGEIWTNYLRDDFATITYSYNTSSSYTKVPTVSYSDAELYLGFDNKLAITYNIVEGTNIYFNLPEINNQSFIDNINAIINISTTDVALFFKDSIKVVSKVEDTNLEQGFRYDLTNTKLSTGVRYGDDVINTLEGAYTIFPTRRGLAALSYQAFMATTDQTIDYITDTIKDNWKEFYEASETIKVMQWKNFIIVTNNTNTMLLYSITKSQWWKWKIPTLTQYPLKLITNQELLWVINKQLNVFEESFIVDGEEVIVNYYDFSKTSTDYNKYKIDWLIESQPLHFNAINYYKNIKQLVFQFFDKKEEEEAKSILAQIKLYRKKITIAEPETVAFSVEQLRTFVKRFNYWKINELQWGLANDPSNSNPARFELNGISVKYEIGEQVR